MSRNETGRVTIPTDVDMVPQTLDVLKLSGIVTERNFQRNWQIPVRRFMPLITPHGKTMHGQRLIRKRFSSAM